jgi:hypothetical protein
MGKKGSGSHANERTRLNPLTGEVERVGGTKAGRNRNRESFGSALRTHDLAPKKQPKAKVKDVPAGESGA